MHSNPRPPILGRVVNVEQDIDSMYNHMNDVINFDILKQTLSDESLTQKIIARKLKPNEQKEQEISASNKSKLKDLTFNIYQIRDFIEYLNQNQVAIQQYLQDNGASKKLDYIILEILKMHKLADSYFQILHSLDLHEKYVPEFTQLSFAITKMVKAGYAYDINPLISDDLQTKINDQLANEDHFMVNVDENRISKNPQKKSQKKAQLANAQEVKVPEPPKPAVNLAKLVLPPRTFGPSAAAASTRQPGERSAPEVLPWSRKKPP